MGKLSWFSRLMHKLFGMCELEWKTFHVTNGVPGTKTHNCRRYRFHWGYCICWCGVRDASL